MSSRNQSNDEIKEKRRNRLLYLLILFIVFGVIPGLAVVLLKVFHPKFVGGKTTDEKAKLLKIDLKDYPKDITLETWQAWLISAVLLVIFVVVLTIFWRERNHHLINYRPIILCMGTGICSAVYCVILPVIAVSDYVDCFNRLIFTVIFGPLSMMFNLSRYTKLYLLNRRDISRLKLFNERTRSKNFDSDSDNLSSEFEPNLYVKRLNQLVNKQVPLILFIIMFILFVATGIFIQLFRGIKREGFEGNNPDVCNNQIVLYTPIIALNIIHIVVIPFYYVYLRKSLNFVNKMDIIINFIGSNLGSFLFMSSLFVLNPSKNKYYFLLSNLKNNALLFLVPSFISFACADIFPLIEVWMYKMKEKGKKHLTKKEFTRNLLKSSFVEALKSKAVNYYCVEVVLFWELHMKLMKRVSESVVKPMNEKRKSLGKQEQKINESSHENAQTIKNDSISPPVQSNYELLLGLNKNIFGDDNNQILYTGCFSNNGIHPNLINYAMKVNADLHRQEMMNANINNNIYSSSWGQSGATSPVNQNDITMMNANRTRAFSLDEINNRTRSDSAPTITVVSNSSYPQSPVLNNNNNNNPYYNRQRNDSNFSLVSNNSAVPYNDKAGLLYHSNPYETNSQNGMNTSLNRGYDAPSIAHQNSKKTSQYYNKNTEIYYELFEIDPNFVELPTNLWKDYNKLFNSFISDRSLATVNLSDELVNKLTRAVQIRNYSIDMFFPAIAETVDLMYRNIYPKISKKN